MFSRIVGLFIVLNIGNVRLNDTKGWRSSISPINRVFISEKIVNRAQMSKQEKQKFSNQIAIKNRKARFEYHFFD